MNSETRDAAIRMHEEHIVRAVRESDADAINLIARCLVMADEAKQILRDKGYGWSGLDIVETAKLVETVNPTWEQRFERDLAQMSPVARKVMRWAYHD